MAPELYKDLDFNSWILLNGLDTKSILKRLQIEKVEKMTWKKAINKRIGENIQFIKAGDWMCEKSNRVFYPIIVAEINREWTLLLSDIFKERKLALKYCLNFCTAKNHVYNFFMDYHIGYDRWIVFKENKLIKLCERNDNDEMHIYGKLDQAENLILTEKANYYDLTDFIELYLPFFKNLDYCELENKTAFYATKSLSGTGTSRRTEIEDLGMEIKYLNPIMNPGNFVETKSSGGIGTEINDELPF